MRLLDSVLGDFRTRTVLLCAFVGNTCKTSRPSNINIASLLTRHNVLLICNEFCSQLISSHVNASNSPLRSVHTKESSIANRSHDTLQWCKRSWICSGDRNTDGVPPCEMGCDPHIPTGQLVQKRYVAVYVRFSMYWPRQTAPHICGMVRNISALAEVPCKV